MDKEELKQLLRENLSVDIYTERTSESYYESANTKTVISVYFAEDLICTAENTVYD